MSSGGTLRLFIIVLLLAFLVAGPAAVSGCGGSTPSASGTRPVGPLSNATGPDAGGEEATRGDNTTAPGGEEKPARPEDLETEAAIRAAKASALAGNPSIGELEVTNARVVGSWALVGLEPVDGSTDGAIWLLTKSGGAWQVVEYGTSILPADHPEAPGELF